MDVIREMEGGVAYAITLDGRTSQGLRTALSRAASELGLKVRFARQPRSATEVIVQLVEEPQ